VAYELARREPRTLLACDDFESSMPSGIRFRIVATTIAASSAPDRVAFRWWPRPERRHSRTASAQATGWDDRHSRYAEHPGEKRHADRGNKTVKNVCLSWPWRRMTAVWSTANLSRL
jgi:hypothetical protein